MSEEKKKKGLLEKLAEFFEITEVKEVAKPPAKTQEKPVHVEETKSVQPPEASAIEVKEPEPVEPVKIGEEGKKRRIKI